VFPNQPHKFHNTCFLTCACIHRSSILKASEISTISGTILTTERQITQHAELSPCHMGPSWTKRYPVIFIVKDPIGSKGLCHIISKVYCHNVLRSVQYKSSFIPEHTMSVMQYKHSSEALCLWSHRWFLLSFQSVCMSRYRYVHTEACSLVLVNFLCITSCARQGYSKVCMLELTYVH